MTTPTHYCTTCDSFLYLKPDDIKIVKPSQRNKTFIVANGLAHTVVGPRDFERRLKKAQTPAEIITVVHPAKKEDVKDLVAEYLQPAPPPVAPETLQRIEEPVPVEPESEPEAVAEAPELETEPWAPDPNAFYDAIISTADYDRRFLIVTLTNGERCWVNEKKVKSATGHSMCTRFGTPCQVQMELAPEGMRGYRATLCLIEGDFEEGTDIPVVVKRWSNSGTYGHTWRNDCKAKCSIFTLTSEPIDAVENDILIGTLAWSTKTGAPIVKHARIHQKIAPPTDPKTGTWHFE